MKLSIIIPIYNVERYLSKCIDSCVQQNVDYDSYEIILVNDGSTDGSLKIAEKYCSQYPNVKLINQSNQGLSMARNNGLKIAIGDYVWFVDSDDWIEPTSLEKLAPLMDGCDVISQRKYYKKYPNRDEIVSFEDKVSTGKELTTCPYPVGAPFYVYKASFLRDLGFGFRSGIYHEDTLFSPIALYYAKTVNCCFVPLYNNLKRGGSITTTYKPQKVFDLIEIFTDLYEFQNKTVSKEYKKAWGEGVLSGTLLELLYLTKLSKDSDLKRKVKLFVNTKECRYALKISRHRNSRFIYYFSFLLFGNIYMAYSLLYKIRY